MGFKPIDTSCWLNFLRYHGFSRDRSKGSHFIWTKPGSLRSIPVRENDKQVPALHLKTGCATIGCTSKELEKWIDDNC